MISAVPARPELRATSDEWFTLPRLLLLLAAFILIAFPTVVIGTDSFFYRDMGQFGYPLAKFHREAFWRGEVPLWNPLNNCGLPFLGQWNTLVLYPGSLIYLLLPLPWSMNWFMFAHMFLAAAGMYALARRWTNDRFAASAAGLIFAWNGLTLHVLMWPNNMAALGWMPWVVLALERAWREGGRRVFVGALVGAMQMLTGAPEIILLTWLIIGVFWLRDFIGKNGPRTQLFFRFAFCSAMIFALCAVQLLPFLDLLRHSDRDTSYGGPVWSMPLWGWANFVVPMFGCTPSVVGVYSQDAQQWTSSYYMGIATVAFALLAWRTQDARVKWLAGITLAGLVMALGDDAHVYAVLKKILPVLGFVRFPIKYVVLAAFALPLLAAFGVKAFQDLIEQKRAKAWLDPVLIAVGVAVAVLVLLARTHPIPGTLPPIITNSACSRIGFLLLALAALTFSRGGGLLRARVTLVLFLVALGTDVLTHMPRQNPVVPNRAYGPLPLDEMANVPKMGESRAMISPPMNQALAGLANPDPLTMFVGHRRMLLSDCNLLDSVPKVDGFYSLYLREVEQITRRLCRSTNYDLPLLDFLGVTQLSDAAELFAWHTRSNAMPLVSAGQEPVIASAPETFAGILATTFAPREIAYLPEKAQADADGVRSGQCKIISSEMKRESVVVEVNATALSLVVISQAHAPSWRAFVDGRSTPLWKANYGFQAVVVPAGQHRVELRYEDWLFRGGAIASTLSLLTCLGFLGRRSSSAVHPAK
jgi:hypothetical protein